MNGDAGVRFSDHFSGHAASYAAHRPSYPRALYEYLAAVAPRRGHAWDCATGNGQCAVGLARDFAAVTATDASETQIRAARPHPRVTYRVAVAEQSGLAERSMDLVTVAQALHWFDLPRFFVEVARVAAPQAVLAAWCYGLCRVAPECDRPIERLYGMLDPYWPPERRLVEAGYRGIELPFPAIETPSLEMRVSWSADDMLGYLATWSASQRCRRERGENPVDGIRAELRAAWGDGARTVRWPLALLAGRVES